MKSKYKVYEDENGTIYWYNDKEQLHREDGPAEINPLYQLECWYYEGKYHRVDGPAVKHKDGHCEWWHHGVRHRADGPAIIWDDGETHWYYKGAKLSLIGIPAEVTIKGFPLSLYLSYLRLKKEGKIKEINGIIYDTETRKQWERVHWV